MAVDDLTRRAALLKLRVAEGLTSLDAAVDEMVANHRLTRAGALDLVDPDKPRPRVEFREFKP